MSVSPPPTAQVIRLLQAVHTLPVVMSEGADSAASATYVELDAFLSAVVSLWLRWTDAHVATDALLTDAVRQVGWSDLSPRPRGAAAHSGAAAAAALRSVTDLLSALAAADTARCGLLVWNDFVHVVTARTKWHADAREVTDLFEYFAVNVWENGEPGQAAVGRSWVRGHYCAYCCPHSRTLLP